MSFARCSFADKENSSPVQQWTAVSQGISNVSLALQSGLVTYWAQELGSTPDASWTTEAGNLQTVYQGGTFAGPVTAALFDPRFFAVIASVGINSLWNGDHVFIVKMSDNTIKGVAACDVLPAYSTCINDIAYIFLRWVWYTGPAPITSVPIIDTSSLGGLDTTEWEVKGAYPASQGGQGNYLSDTYHLTLDDIALSSDNTQSQYGFYYQGGNNDTAATTTADSENATLDQLLSWNLPVCNLDVVLSITGSAKKLPSNAVCLHAVVV